MQQNPKSEFLTKLVCAKEYAYREDTNYPIRNKMEDGILYNYSTSTLLFR